MPVGSGARSRPQPSRGLAHDFHEKHRMTYGHASPDEPVQLVNSARGRGRPSRGLALGRESTAAPGSPRRSALRPARGRHTSSETGLVPCDVLPRTRFAARGSSEPGPLIVEAVDTTIVVPPGLAVAGRPPGGSSCWRSSRSCVETDPATFEVVKNALYAAAEEMKVVLAKTAYSPLLKVAGRLFVRALRRRRARWSPRGRTCPFTSARCRWP